MKTLEEVKQTQKQAALVARQNFRIFGSCDEIPSLRSETQKHWVNRHTRYTQCYRTTVLTSTGRKNRAKFLVNLTNDSKGKREI